MPVMSLIASVTMIEPIEAHSTPSTPPSAQDVLREDLHHVVVVQACLVDDDIDQRIDLGDGLLGGQGLRLPDVGLTVDDLTLQVRLVDGVELDDAEGSDAGRGEVEQSGTAKTTSPDDQDLRVLQPFLPLHAHIGDDQVTAVATDLVTGQLSSRFDERREGHRDSSKFMKRDQAMTPGTPTS
jgi:hypothetical protein